MGNEPTKGSKKINNQLERLFLTNFFNDEVKRIRRVLHVPSNGFTKTAVSRDLKESYDQEFKSIYVNLPIVTDNLLKKIQDHILCNIPLENNYSDEVAQIETADSEFEHYSMNEDPDSMGKNAFNYNDNIEERLNRYPIAVWINADASQRDIVEFIRKNWDRINNLQKKFRKSKKVSIRNSQTGLKHRKPRLFMYEHRNEMSHKELRKAVGEKFGENEKPNYEAISKIISEEDKRRKL